MGRSCLFFLSALPRRTVIGLCGYRSGRQSALPKLPAKTLEQGAPVSNIANKKAGTRRTGSDLGTVLNVANFKKYIYRTRRTGSVLVFECCQ